MPLVCLRHRRYRLVAGSVAAEAAYFAGVYCAWRLNPRAATWVFIVPYFVTSLALMFGK